MKSIVIPLRGLDCYDCARVIETSLKQMPGACGRRAWILRARN